MMKNKTYKAFTQNPQFACPYAIRDLIKGLDSKDTSESSWWDSDTAYALVLFQVI